MTIERKSILKEILKCTFKLKINNQKAYINVNIIIQSLIININLIYET